MCKVPTLCCLVLVGLIEFVASQIPIQNIQVLDEGGDDNEMVILSENSCIKLFLKLNSTRLEHHC